MQNRRDFLKTATLAALGSGLVVRQTLAGESSLSNVYINKLGLGGKMKMSFFPYELKLKHVFTVATYSRTTTPDVQVEIEYEGITGYGEASMPPYLGETVESVMSFLGKVNLEQFSDPFQLDDILSYVDSLSPKDTAAKAAVDIALHDLVGKLLDAPWYKIWGLNKEKTPSTTFTIGIDTPDVVREKTKECADQFNILKVKLGRDNDKEMIETIRSVTNLPIAIDANQGWKDRQYALDMIHWLKEKIKEYQLDYILFGNHHYHTDEKFPYFGHHTENLDMLELYEESAIEGMESGLFCCLAHPDLFMRSYPQFDRHCKLISRHICRTAARLHIPLEYNIGYVAYNEAHNLQTYPCPDFWHIAANEGCTAIIGLDAHNNKDLETPVYYNRAIEELKALKIQRVDSLSLITNH